MKTPALLRDEIELLHELCMEEEIQLERRRSNKIRLVIVSFPMEILTMAGVEYFDQSFGAVHPRRWLK